MYPGTIFNWYDQSGIVDNEVTVSENAPLFLAAASFDKGPEDMRVVSGQQFYRLYGNKIDFAKHGQPALQIKNIIDNGGRVLIKRVVADDATLANIVFVANVNVNIVAVPDTTGSDKAKTINEITGQSTASDTDETPRYLVDASSTTTIKWTAVSVENARTVEDVVKGAEALMTNNDLTAGDPDADGKITITGQNDIPVIIVADNGRGFSNKAVKFAPDYNSSKNTNNFFYASYIYEGTNMVDRTIASLNPDTVINSVNYSFGEQDSDQVNYVIYQDGYEKYVNELASATGFTTKQILGYDIINLIDSRKVKLPGVALSDESIDLNAPYGVTLTNGTNGAFGDAPFGTTAYDEQLVEFYSGNFDNSIFDLDQYKIAAVVDANYSVNVKEAIAELVNFREDCFFFRDLGTEISTFENITDMLNKFKTFGKFIGDYMTSYQIYDPSNGKRIKVTMMYDLAAVLVSHFANGAYHPVAGIANNIILRSAIKGTINFTPRITPHVNQKSMLEDIKINYAIFDQDQCVVQTLYTSQDQYTQLSYINNVLAIQEVARAVRSSCPKYRYTFTSGIDFSSYAAEVSSVLANYRNNFAELTFQYAQSAVHASQKIFYATLSFRFNNWAQTEIFDLYALPTETVGQ